MKVEDRRDHVMDILRKRNRYQFGQPNSALVGNAGCTDTSIQMIVWMTKGLKVSLNEVRRRSGAAAGAPMTNTQAVRALRSFGLPYDDEFGKSAGQLLTIARNRGPVIIGEMYWAHPQWKGYSYAGRELNGRARNDSGRTVLPGFSHPLKRSGLTQWTFRGGHAVLLATDEWKDGEHFGIVRDPNHNSPSRPERPAYDRVNMNQLRRMVESWPGSTYAVVPTRVVIK